MRKLTHEEFLEKLYEKNEYYRNGEFAVVGEYINTDSYIDVIDIRCIRYSMKCGALLQNNRPCVRVAIDKSDYFRNIIYELHGDRYNYDKIDYKDNDTKVDLVCPIHGIFSILPGDLMRGRGCKKCATNIITNAITKNTDEFIKQAKSIHNDKYTYDNLVYVNANTLCDIICPTHGTFSQLPYVHLRGCGCQKCAFDDRSKKAADRGLNPLSHSEWGIMASRSKHFDSFKVYIAICSDDDELFIKIGKTFRPADDRFKLIPYNTKLHHMFIDKDPVGVSMLEQDIKNKLSTYKYKTKKSFGGHRECFNIEALHNGTIDKLIKELNVSGQNYI